MKTFFRKANVIAIAFVAVLITAGCSPQNNTQTSGVDNTTDQSDEPESADDKAHAKDEAPSSRYMGGPTELVTAPSGAIVNKDVLDQLPKTGWTNGPEIENPVEGIHVLGGYLISRALWLRLRKGSLSSTPAIPRKTVRSFLRPFAHSARSRLRRSSMVTRITVSERASWPRETKT